MLTPKTARALKTGARSARTFPSGRSLRPRRQYSVEEVCMYTRCEYIYTINTFATKVPDALSTPRVHQ